MRAHARTCILCVLGGGPIKLAQLITVHIKFTAHLATREVNEQKPMESFVTDFPIVPPQGDSHSFIVTMKASIHHVALQNSSENSDLKLGIKRQDKEKYYV